MPPAIPSPIDLRSMSDAVAWEAAAMVKRPWRVDFFEAVADAIRPVARRHPRAVRAPVTGRRSPPHRGA